MTIFGAKHTFLFTSQFLTKRFNKAGNIQNQIFYCSLYFHKDPSAPYNPEATGGINYALSYLKACQIPPASGIKKSSTRELNNGRGKLINEKL